MEFVNTEAAYDLPTVSQKLKEWIGKCVTLEQIDNADKMLDEFIVNRFAGHSTVRIEESSIKQLINQRRFDIKHQKI